MTVKSLTNIDNITMDVNIELIVFCKKVGDVYVCRLASGDNETFKTNPFA